MTGPTIKIDSDNVLAREVDGEIVILDLRRQHYIGGNPSVTVMWPLLEQGATREQLLDALLTKFEVTRRRADADLSAFLTSLEEFGLLAGGPAADGR